MSGGNKGLLVSSSSSPSTAAASIPAASKKMVLSLKEIVSCSELEIYAMLKECNMDPNETVDRLLTQDRFHEVKSKREKKKEGKDPSESRPRGGGHSANRGGRGNTDRYGGRSSSTQFVSTETSAFGKSAYKKENGGYPNTNTSSHAPRMPGNNITHQPLPWSDPVSKENKISTRGAGDNTLSSSQPSAYQSAWVGVPGQLSMADIVKMGRPTNKTSSAINHSHHTVHDHLTEPQAIGSNQDWPLSQDYTSNDDWPVNEQPPAVAMPSVIEETVGSNHYVDTSGFPFARPNQTHEYQINVVQVQEDEAGESFNPNFVRSGSASSKSVRSVHEDNHGSASHYDNDMYSNINSYQPHLCSHEPKEDGGEPLSSLPAGMQKLKLQEDETGTPPEVDDHSVVIPNHLQVLSADCSHLNFGSFESGITAGDSVPFTSQTLKNDVEETSPSTVADASSVGNSDRNLEYYGDEHLVTTSDGNLVHRTNTGTEGYNMHSTSQPEVLNPDTPNVGQGNQYAYPSTAPGYAFENSQQLNAAYAHSNTQMQNMAPFSSVMQSYANSLPNALLASTVQPTRESDLPYSPFSGSQSVPTKYNNTASSISGSPLSMSEQQTQQAQPSGNPAAGPALPQHPVHPYSQPALPVGPFGNMIGYPFLPQSYTYMPSAFQQAFGGNSSYHQSLAAALPQYKNSVSASNLPQSAAIASGYGAFGNSTNVPSNFPMNPSTATAAGTTVGYDDIINSQYKDASQLLSLQQGDNSGMWVHGPGSRTMSAVPANTYYNFQGQQNQQPAAYRQAQQQQPSQQFGGHGYPNYYQSQTGLLLEHQQQQLQQQLQQQQQQSLRDGTIGGSQGQQQSKQSQQLWQNNY